MILAEIGRAEGFREKEKGILICLSYPKLVLGRSKRLGHLEKMCDPNQRNLVSKVVRICPEYSQLKGFPDISSTGLINNFRPHLP